MPYHNQTTGPALKELTMGIQVDRATATLPQTTAAAIFNIIGGRVALLNIVGEVTTVLGVVGNLSLESNPTTGTTAAICAVAAGGALEAGTLLSINGLKATAMLAISAGGVALQQYPVALPVGTLDLRTSASDTGAIKWTAWYVPLDDGAYMTAA